MQNPWAEDWNKRLRELLVELTEPPHLHRLSYPQLLAKYTAKMTHLPSDPLSTGLARFFPLFNLNLRPERSEFQHTIKLDFMPLQRVGILDLQIRLREDTDYVCFGRFGNGFNPASLAKIQQTLKEYGKLAFSIHPDLDI